MNTLPTPHPLKAFADGHPLVKFTQMGNSLYEWTTHRPFHLSPPYPFPNFPFPPPFPKPPPIVWTLFFQQYLFRIPVGAKFVLLFSRPLRTLTCANLPPSSISIQNDKI